MGTLVGSDSELESESLDESEELEEDCCTGCFAGTRVVAFGETSDEGSESESDSEEEEATRRLRFRMRFFGCGGFGLEGAMVDVALQGADHEKRFQFNLSDARL